MPKLPIDSLSPHEYLDYLQHELYGNDLPPYASDVGDVLTANLIASLPPQHRQQLERLAIGVLPTKSINAWVASVPSGGEVIGFDFGIMSFMLALNKILLSRVSLFGFEPTLDIETAAQRAATIVRSFFGAEAFPRFAVAPRRMLVASSLSNAQTAFIVGHELGHVLLGHLRHHQDIGPAEHPHDQEFAADARGAELVINSFQQSQYLLFGGADSAISQSGIDIFFTYLIFMEQVQQTASDASSSTHPSSKDRRAKLRNRFWGDLPENARELATAAEKTFDGFTYLLQNGGDAK